MFFFDRERYFFSQSLLDSPSPAGLIIDAEYQAVELCQPLSQIAVGEQLKSGESAPLPKRRFFSLGGFFVPCA